MLFTRATRLLKNTTETGLNILFPPRCLACGELVGMHGNVCSECWQSIDFTSPPYCTTCGFPFEYDNGEMQCGACLASPPPYHKARSVFHYNEHSKDLILKFKYNDKLHHAPYLAHWMHRAGIELCEESDLIIPVPLHRFRLFTRKYNQSAILAKHLSKRSRIPSVITALIRIKNTPPQIELTRNQRLKNVVGAFKVHPRKKQKIVGKRVLLIDDIMTTGATITACTKSLLAAGAIQVNVLTIGRTVNE